MSIHSARASPPKRDAAADPAPCSKAWAIIGRAPIADFALTGAPGGAGFHAIMSTQPIQRLAEHEFGRTARPATLLLDLFKTLQKPADVHQKPSHFRPTGPH